MSLFHTTPSPRPDKALVAGNRLSARAIRKKHPIHGSCRPDSDLQDQRRWRTQRPISTSSRTVEKVGHDGESKAANKSMLGFGRHQGE